MELKLPDLHACFTTGLVLIAPSGIEILKHTIIQDASPVLIAPSGIEILWAQTLAFQHTRF